MSPRLLFVFLVAMLIGTAFSFKCFVGKGKDAKESECSGTETCTNVAEVKNCGTGATCIVGDPCQKLTGDMYNCCCKGNLCNSSQSTSIAAAVLIALFAM